MSRLNKYYASSCKKWVAVAGVVALVIVVVGVSVMGASSFASRMTSDVMVHQDPMVGMVPFAETFYEFADGTKVCNKVFYFELDNFLTPAQCDELRAAAIDHNMYDSKVGESKSSLDLNVRRSTQTWFKHDEHDLAKFIKEKVKSLISSGRLGGCFNGVSADKDFEDVQVVRYAQQGKYDPHYDATECGDDLGVPCIANQRIATVLMYLNDDFEGGETRFPHLNVSVKPKKGKALFFWVSDQRSRLVYNETLHGGDPVRTGEKWIATQWIRAPGAKS